MSRNRGPSGLFITFEGGDGAGKTTQAERLGSWLASRGLEVVHTREPGGTPLGAGIRRLLLHGGDEIGEAAARAEALHGAIDSRAEALLFAADRAQHVARVVRPALERGAVVVQDRYIDSSLAYQGAGRPLDPAEIRDLSEWATGGLWPALTVLLDVDPETAALRRGGRGEAADRLENESVDFHRRVREGFLELAAADPRRFLVLDGSLSAEELQAGIRARVEIALGRLASGQP